ncbi:vomeronasal 1 receptor ornAnaV1R3038 [Ornithorhynchus anatinus]|uniref:Vomeronasal type-1 receptor n=1 Tax=Ornithorhynchus anatinus TaxID=9258 RepID=A0A6I8PM47_ORNAN|nr:vomeronasal 1 receptor ornAnaV1R3038 [Ornithorhynchus anatinus]
MLLQISTGASANVFLLLFYTHMAFSSHKLSSSDLILTHLALANIIFLLIYGIPETISPWGWRNFLDTIGCKIVLYVYRVARGLSICTTCLLSIFQAIAISTSTSRWAGFKAKLPKCIIPSFSFFWVLNLLIDISALVYAFAPQNSTTIQITYDLKYCSVMTLTAEATLLNAIMFSGHDRLFVGLMSTASGYMVLILHRHHQRVRHLRGPGSYTRATPEVLAAKRIVALVTLYVLLFGRHSIMSSILLNTKEKSPLLVNINTTMLFGFPVISPFLVIHSDRRIGTLWKRESTVSIVDSS